MAERTCYEPEGEAGYSLSYSGAGADGDHVEHGRHLPLRLSENWQNPEPITGCQEFLGADRIRDPAGCQWLGEDGFQWEPRFVAAGSYELIGIAFEEDNQRQDIVGHQMLLDLDLRVTGTERVHVQLCPLGDDCVGHRCPLPAKALVADVPGISRHPKLVGQRHI